MILSFHPCLDADVQIILGDRPVGPVELRWIRQAQAIILPQGCKESLYSACANSGSLLFPNYDLRFLYPGKTGQSRLFQEYRIPHPPTRSWGHVHALRDFYERAGVLPHTPPFLVKSDNSHESEGVYVVTEERAFPGLLEKMERRGGGLKGLVTQVYVPCAGNVLRVVIIGRQIFAYWKREESAGDWTTSLSRNARIDYHWHPELREKAVSQARCLSRQTGINLAGLDYVFGMSQDDPAPLLLEINYYFGRRGLGGTLRYYALLYRAVQDFLSESGLDTGIVRLA